MKTLNLYIKEHLDKGDRVCSIVTFKDNMMKASEIKEGLLSVFKDTERDWNQDWYDNIKFQEYFNEELIPVRYQGSDQDVLTFDKFSNNTVYEYNQKITKKFIEDLDNAKNDIVQISLPNVKETIYMTIQPDSSSNWLNIVFSNDEPKELEQD